MSDDRWNANKRVALVYDTVSGPVREELFPFGALPTDGTSVDVDLSAYAGKNIEIVFETRGVSEGDPVMWGSPEILLGSGDGRSVEAQSGSQESVFGEQPKVTNAVLIILDAWRYDRLRIAGAKRNAAPFLDDLATVSTVFERAYAAAPYTYSSTASLLTGLHPFQHKAYELRDGFSEALASLPATLGEAGIRTGCVSANPNLSLETGLAGGFEEYQDATENLGATPDGAPELVTEHVRSFLENHDEGPFFLYAHYRQPHEPYDALPEFANTLSHQVVETLGSTAGELKGVNSGSRGITREEVLHLEARYDENFRVADAEVRKIFEMLEAKGLDENTAVIVTADHGEAFREHGLLGHNLTVYDDMTRIPFILKLPGDSGGRLVRESVAQTVDIFPTVCALLGVEVPENLAGRNLLSEAALTPLGVRAMSMTPDRHGWQAYWFDRYKLILNRFRAPVEVYDLQRDHAERDNLANIAPVLADSLRARALRWKRVLSEQTSGVRATGDSTPELSEQTQERLKALGYVD